METRNRHIASMTLLIAALVLFVAFHVLPGFRHDDGGWGVWRSLWFEFRNPRGLFRFPREAIIIACFLNFSVLIVASPFLTRIWRKSRPAWWFATIFSALAAAGFWGVFLVQGQFESVQAGGWCLLIAPILNFLGLILARGKPAPATPEAPH